jgi:uncharacterized protein YbcV (DUF1398 family)
MRYKSLNEEDVEIYRVDRRGYFLTASGIERVEQEQAQVEYKEEKKEKKKSKVEDIIKKIKKIAKKKPQEEIKFEEYTEVDVRGE